MNRKGDAQRWLVSSQGEVVTKAIQKGWEGQGIGGKPGSEEAWEGD